MFGDNKTVVNSGSLLHARDNKTVVNSGSLPHMKLHKRHTMLLYHRVHEAIACGMVKFYHIPGEIIPADILRKH